MPEEFRALQESFAEVERSVEAEKEKMFSSYSAVEQKMAQIEKQLDDMAFTINARSDRFQKVYKKFAREVSLGLLMYASLPQRQSPEPAQRDEGRFAARPAACTPAERTHESRNLCSKNMRYWIRTSEKMEKLNQTMKPWLSEQKYDEILKKVEAQLKKTNLSDDSQIGFGAF